MAEFRIVNQHYFAESDELDLWITEAGPQEALSVPVDDYFYLRVHPTTGEIVGATILNASYWFAGLARAFATHALDHPDVHFFLERKLESLAPAL